MTKSPSQTAPKLILGSSSPYRRAQLTQLSPHFQCISPEVNESPLHGENAENLATRLSVTKAKAVAEQSTSSNSLVIAGDQCAARGSELLGKPGSEERAFQQLSESSGKTLRFYSGLCVLSTLSGETKTACIVTEVQFRELNEREIWAYIDKEKPIDCAGSFKCEGLGISLFENIRSDDPSALVGLPLITLARFLREFSYDLLR